MPRGASALTTTARPPRACTRSSWKVVWLSERSSDAAVERQAALARDVRVGVAFGEDRVGAPLGQVAGEAGEVVAEVRAAGGFDRRVVGGDREAARLGVHGARPGVADDRAPVAVRQPLVPDRRAVLLDRVGGQRRVVALDPAPHVAQVVVDAVVDLVLHPDRGRLGEPGVLVGVVAELEDVVVLVGDGDLEVVLGRGAGELARVVVVVEDQVAVQVARQPVRLRAPGRGRAPRSRRARRRSRPGRCRSCRCRRPCGRRTWARASRACRSRSSGRVRRPPAPARRSRARRRRCASARLGASMPSATQWTQKCRVQAGDCGASGTV